MECDGFRIVTDPYDPELLGLPAISEAADVVIRSSADDRAHGCAEVVPKRFGVAPAIVTGLEIAGRSTTVGGVEISAVECREGSLRAKPRRNAMYRFRFGGLDIAHFGDAGEKLMREHLEFLRGAEVVLVPAGGPPTLELGELLAVCRALQFPLIIPMHFQIPGAKPRMLPVTAFTSLFRLDEVEWAGTSSLEIEKSNLPQSQRVLVLEPQVKPRRNGQPELQQKTRVNEKLWNRGTQAS
jgi:L-ascorbate metabolism protein UlaG (beta-lactamase superfamily)